MARLYPFRALRYDPTRVNMTDVVTQPYDKISPDMQERYYAASPYNLIRIVLGKTKHRDTEKDNVYTRAAATLKDWRAEGILQEESEPALYGYSQTYTVPGTSAAADGKPEIRERRGFIALGHLYDYADKVVFRHEQTFPKHKSDRLALFKATRAYCEQIYMLYSDPTFTAEHLIFGDSGAGETKPADLEITDEYGVLHRVWKLADPALIQQVLDAMADKQLIIADGHHRYETSTAYMHERAAELGFETSVQPSSSTPQSLSSQPEIISSSLSSRPEAISSSLSSRPDISSSLSSRPEAEGRSGEIPAFRVASAEGTSKSAEGAAGSSPLDSGPQEGRFSPGSPAATAAALPAPPFPEAAMMMTFVNMDAPGITILPTHRVAFGFPHFDGREFARKAEQFFTLEEIPNTPDGHYPGASGLLNRLNQAPGVAFIAATRDGDFLLTPKPEAIAPLLAGLSPRQAALDVTQLHKVVLEKLLGLNEETVRAGHHIRYVREAQEALQQVGSGNADVAFLIKPVTLEQMKDISLNLEVMPQKSTDFYPKLLSGLAMYTLD